jgi:hypothetical protein
LKDKALRGGTTLFQAALIWFVSSLPILSPIQTCDEIIVVHLGYLNYTCYQIAVSFKGLENVTYDFKVDFVVSG